MKSLDGSLFERLKLSLHLATVTRGSAPPAAPARRFGVEADMG